LLSKASATYFGIQNLSLRTGLPKIPNEEQRAYLDYRFENILECATMSVRKLMLFGGAYYKRLFESKYKIGDPIKISENKDGASFNMYLFLVGGIPCVLFDKFLGSGHYYGLKDEDLCVFIPNKIRERFGSATWEFEI
jgi:hypothetical protein